MAKYRTYDTRGLTLTVNSPGEFGAPAGDIPIRGITDFSGPSFSASELPVTDLESGAVGREPGLPDYGEVSLTLFGNAGSIEQRILAAMGQSESIRSFTATLDQRTLFAAATAATIRGVAFTAASGATPAIATFSGTNIPADVRESRNFASGSCIIAGGVAYVLGAGRSATTFSVTRLDGAPVTTVSSAATFSVVRPQIARTFEAYVSSFSETYATDARITADVSLMIDGEVTTTRTAS